HNGEERPALDVLQADYHREFVDDPERCEYFVPVQWLHSLPLNEAVKEVGLFGNQNTICRPTTRGTLEGALRALIASVRFIRYPMRGLEVLPWWICRST
ncbi:hypothetical protein ACV334_39120, partial [Pseudomonas aeruginosa]